MKNINCSGCRKIQGKILFFLALCIFAPCLPLFAQDSGVEPAAGAEENIALPGASALIREDLWICPVAEIAMYSISSAAYGGGVMLGYGNRAAVGLKAAWFADGSNEVKTMELSFLFRWYFLRPSSGLYLQFNGGPVFFAQKESLAIPSALGVISAGISLGWRIPIGRYWFAEGAVRAGYPYIAGGGLSFGFHY